MPLPTLLLTFFIMFYLSSSYAEEKKFIFGIVPQQSASKLARLWRPILDELESKTQIKFVFSTAKTIPIFEQRLADGKYDIAYMNPYHYTVFHKNPGYIAIAKQKNKKIRGIIVAPKNTNLLDINDLDNKALAFPAPAAFAASVLPRAHFKKHNISIIPQYVSSHDSVYLSVAKGIYPAGGGVLRTFNNVAPKIKSQLKILWTTEAFTPHAIAIHPRIKEYQQKLQSAFLYLNQQESTRKKLQAINFKGIELAENSEWDDVRSLDINLLDHFVENE